MRPPTASLIVDREVTEASELASQASLGVFLLCRGARPRLDVICRARGLGRCHGIRSLCRFLYIYLQMRRFLPERNGNLLKIHKPLVTLPCIICIAFRLFERAAALGAN